MDKKTKKKMPTSKFLVYIVTFSWLITIFASLTGWLLLNKTDFAILITVSSAFTIVLNGFFAKSFLENKQQYSSNYTSFEQPVTVQSIKQEET